MLRKQLYILIGCLFSIFELQAQGTNGKDFWVAYMSMDWRCTNGIFFNHKDTPKLFLSSRYAAKVNVKVAKFNFNQTYTLQPQKTTIVYLPSDMASEFTDTIIANSAHIVADTFINVHAVNSNSTSTGSTLVIPSESIPYSPEYILTTFQDGLYYGWLCDKKRIQTSEFTIVGISDSSVIEVIPTGASWKSKANVPFQITLKKGETFHLLSSDLDLTGSVIRSKYINSKFGVFAGNRVTGNFRSGCSMGWDNSLEQMIPTVCWGQYYTAIPFQQNKFGYTLKIVAAENNTSLFIDGKFINIFNQGEFYIHQVYKDTVTQIKASNKISVSEFALGGCRSRKDSIMGDIAMVMIFPDNQMGTAATVNTIDPETKGWIWPNQFQKVRYRPEHYLNVLTKTTDTSYFLIENKKPANSVWKTAPNISGYHYAQIQLDSGCYDLTSTKGFLAYVYGYSPAEGYAYAAAANFRLLQNNFIIINAQCVRDTTFFRAIENDSFTNYKWNFGDNSAMAYGPKVKHKYRDTGWYTVVMYCYHKRTNDKDSVTKTIYIADTKVHNLFGKDTMICGKLNYVQMSKGFQSGNTYKWNDGWNLYYKLIKNTGLYWLEMQERNGCTLRDTLRVFNGIIPKSDFSVSDDTFCLNRSKTVEFRNYSTSSDTINEYSWDFGPAVIKTTKKDTVFSYNFPKAGTYPVILRTTTTKGCYHDTIQIVEVLFSPKAEFIFSKKDTCFNSNEILLQNKTVVNTLYHKRYKWYFSEGYNLSNSNPGSRKYSNTGDYYILLIYENKNGCIDTMRQNVRIVPNPKAGFTFDTSLFCSHDTITFNNTSSSSFKPLRYLWEFGDSSSSTDSNARKAWSGYGKFSTKLKVTAPTGCSDSSIATVNVTRLPEPDFTINKDTQCFKGHNFNFTNSSQFTTGPLNYKWNMGDGYTRNDSNIANYKYPNDSNRIVKLFADYKNRCKANIEKTVYLGAYPVAKFKIDKDKQCYRGNEFNFINQSSISKDSIDRYYWQTGDGNGFTSTDINKYTYKTEDTFKVRLIAVSNKNCSDTMYSNAITFAQPIVEITLPNDSQCWQKNSLKVINKTKLKYGKLSSYWNFGDYTTSTNFQVNNKTYPNRSAQYNINYQAVSDHGCSDTGSLIFTLLERPVSAFDINDSIQCFKGHQFTFDNKTRFSVMNTLSYWWNYANGDTSIGYTAKNITYSKPGKYAVRLVSHSTLTNCYDTLYKTVIAAPHAQVDFGINKDTQCLRFNQFKFTNTSTVEFGSMNWNWSFGDGSKDTAKNPIKSYKTESDYQIKLVASTNYDCSDSITKQVAFYPTPKADFTVNDTAQCLNAHSFDFVNTSNISSGTYTTEWLMDDNTGSNDTNVKDKRFASGGYHSIRLSLISDKGCKDTTVNLVYLENIHNSTIENDGKDSQCLRGNAFNFRLTNRNPKVKITSVKWLFGDGDESGAYLPMPKTYLKDSSYRVILATLSQLGCYDTSYRNIIVHPHPITKFTAEEVCYPEPVKFVNRSSIKKGKIDQYKWYFGDGGQSAEAEPQYRYRSYGYYDVTLISISENGCTDQLTLPKIAKVKQKPFAYFGFRTVTSNVADENWVQFKNYSRGANNYLWDFGNQTGSSDKDPIAKFRDTGRFMVKLIAMSAEGCSDTAELSTGFLAPDLYYFLPNAFTPNGNGTNEVYKGQGSHFVYSFRMTIFNRWGEKLFETTDINQGWDGMYQGTMCMEGVYLCKVQIVPFKGTMKVYEQTFTLLR